MTTVETATGTAKTMVLNMGPQHPSTHGVLRILLQLDGEQPGVLPGRGKTARTGSSEARAIHPRSACRVATHFLAPGLARNARPRPRGDVCFPLLFPRTRRDPKDF